MVDFRKCPKCGGQMDSGRIAGDLRIIKEGDMVGDRTSVLYCRRCGYLELYKEASNKEPWRFRAQPSQPQPAPELVQEKEESERPEEERGRKPQKRLVR